MNPENDTPKPGASLSVRDVVYILFRHKWKILLFSLLGIGAAAVVWSINSPVYESEAKIFVRFVSESRPLAGGEKDSEVVRVPESRGLAIVNSEVEILTSRDCVMEAVRLITPRIILAAYGGGTNEYQAAGVLLKHLNSKVGSSGIVTVRLGHPDPDVAREALVKLIEFVNALPKRNRS